MDERENRTDRIDTGVPMLAGMPLSVLIKAPPARREPSDRGAPVSAFGSFV